MTNSDQDAERSTSSHPQQTRRHRPDRTRDAARALPNNDGSCSPNSGEPTLLSFQFLSLVRDRGGFANHAVAEKWALLVVAILHRCLSPPEAAALRALLPHPFDTYLRTPSAQHRQHAAAGSHEFLLNLCIQENGGLTEGEATRRITAILETVLDLQASSSHGGDAIALDYADAIVACALRPDTGSADTRRPHREVSAYHQTDGAFKRQGSQCKGSLWLAR